MDYVDLLTEIKKLDDVKFRALYTSMSESWKDRNEIKTLKAKSSFFVGQTVICTGGSKKSVYDNMIGTILKKNPKKARLLMCKEDNEIAFSVNGMAKDFELTCPYTLMAPHEVEDAAI